MELNATDYWTMSRNDTGTIIDFRWTDATRNMSEEDFRGGLRVFAGLAEEHRPVGLLVDIRSFGHEPGPDTGTWRAAEITPRYNRAGVRRFGYLVGPGFQGPKNSPVRNDGEDFETAFFDDEAAARSWLAPPPTGG